MQTLNPALRWHSLTFSPLGQSCGPWLYPCTCTSWLSTMGRRKHDTCCGRLTSCAMDCHCMWLFGCWQVVDALLFDFAVMWNVCEERELLHICIVTIKKYFWTMDLHTLFGFQPLKRLLVNRPNNNKNQRRFSHDNNALDLHAMVSSDFSVLKLWCWKSSTMDISMPPKCTQVCYVKVNMNIIKWWRNFWTAFFVVVFYFVFFPRFFSRSWSSRGRWSRGFSSRARTQLDLMTRVYPAQRR